MSAMELNTALDAMDRLREEWGDLDKDAQLLLHEWEGLLLSDGIVSENPKIGALVMQISAFKGFLDGSGTLMVRNRDRASALSYIVNEVILPQVSDLIVYFSSISHEAMEEVGHFVPILRRIRENVMGVSEWLELLDKERKRDDTQIYYG